MFKKAVLVGLAQLLVAGAVYAAPDRVGAVDVGVNISAGFMDDSNTAAYFGGNMSYGITNWSAVGVSLGYQSFGSDLNVGDLNAVPLMFDIYLRNQSADRAYVPYAVLGLGAIFWNFDEEGLAAGSSVDIDTSFGVKLGGGVDWFINDKWALNFEASYTFADADTTVRTANGSVSATSDADYWNVGGGLKYLF